MGAEDATFPDARPVHQITADGFWMDEHEVTNAAFAAFVKATHYITVAERPLKYCRFSRGPVEKLVPGSGVLPTPPKPFHWIIFFNSGGTFPGTVGTNLPGPVAT